MLLRCCESEKRVSLQLQEQKQEKSRAISGLREHYLVLSHAPFLREVSAGRTFLLTVAVVKH